MACLAFYTKELLSMLHDPVVIASYARTPMGGFQGVLSGAKATELGAAAVRAAVDRAHVPPELIERIYMGCVLPAGLGQAPARQVALGAGLPQSVEATTVNKMCGSGMQAAIMAFEALAAGSIDVAIAGGMESMTNAPYALPKHRSGARIGHDRIIDTMMMDGLEDAYEPGKAMGVFAEAAGGRIISSPESSRTTMQSVHYIAPMLPLPAARLCGKSFR